MPDKDYQSKRDGVLEDIRMCSGGEWYDYDTKIEAQNYLDAFVAEERLKEREKLLNLIETESKALAKISRDNNETGGVYKTGMEDFIASQRNQPSGEEMK